MAHLPYGAQAVTDWWNANLAHAGWAQELSERLNTASNRDLGRNVGKGVVHRLVLVAFCLLALFFLFRDGRRWRSRASPRAGACSAPTGSGSPGR